LENSKFIASMNEKGRREKSNLNEPWLSSKKRGGKLISNKAHLS